MLKALKNSYPLARSIYIEHKAMRYPRLIIKADLSLFVRVPLRFSMQELQAFIHKHHKWIESTLLKCHDSNAHIQSILQAHSDEILIFGTWQPLASLYAHHPQAQSLLLSSPQSLKAQLKSTLLDYICSRAPQIAATMGVQYQSIKITNALTRFGSCSYDNRLLFSFILIFAPKELIDYVIIHELAHTQFKNHSQDFWLLVQSHCPNAKAYRSQLRQHARFYPFLLQRLCSIYCK
ncbi:SprT family zinc-dependent metalloprotease [Helicobacter sp. MIT 21-1697]|uniref:YgjP family zinc-dependent metalloprotease n=1 Tax=Helicobacter sp. MIT 21-1697 TaxID=2993733 RepID=UPI00224A4BD8|nr:SprT family zinc-dependent metalloprotease [Helicobacter sp. MIT 21-1697]MCX2717364.1 SprT family zinc-dependent metalloprotease [Helicobacter sp. MIT 21-1697]